MTSDLIVFELDAVRYCTTTNPADYAIYYFDPETEGPGDSVLSGTSDPDTRDLILLIAKLAGAKVPKGSGAQCCPHHVDGDEPPKKVIP